MFVAPATREVEAGELLEPRKAGKKEERKEGKKEEKKERGTLKG